MPWEPCTPPNTEILPCGQGRDWKLPNWVSAAWLWHFCLRPLTAGWATLGWAFTFLSLTFFSAAASHLPGTGKEVTRRGWAPPPELPGASHPQSAAS